MSKAKISPDKNSVAYAFVRNRKDRLDLIRPALLCQQGLLEVARTINRASATLLRKIKGAFVANSLRRNLKPGDRVILSPTGEIAEVAYLTFGCYDVTRASDIVVRLIRRRKCCIVSALNIDVEATMKSCAAKNGWQVN